MDIIKFLRSIKSRVEDRAAWATFDTPEYRALSGVHANLEWYINKLKPAEPLPQVQELNSDDKNKINNLERYMAKLINKIDNYSGGNTPKHKLEKELEEVQLEIKTFGQLE